ncbi:hypothetical protein JCGZ_00068 [Jatropha curcas]|uniref:Uncharacterized protein n=1 Tax=Jatropha curcas TaxID=180498 RepID=A0A067JIN1_JATCU|nr:hypothetical protein JCGZ_00068 [Jatropha curcas]
MRAHLEASRCQNRLVSPKIEEQELLMGTVSFAPLEALLAGKEARKWVKDPREGDRHLALVERWSEMRRKGRRSRLSRAQKKKKRGRKEETKSVSRSFRFNSNRFGPIQ